MQSCGSAGAGGSGSRPVLASSCSPCCDLCTDTELKGVELSAGVLEVMNARKVNCPGRSGDVNTQHWGQWLILLNELYFRHCSYGFFPSVCLPGLLSGFVLLCFFFVLGFFAPCRFQLQGSRVFASAFASLSNSSTSTDLLFNF